MFVNTPSLFELPKGQSSTHYVRISPHDRSRRINFQPSSVADNRRPRMRPTRRTLPRRYIDLFSSRLSHSSIIRLPHGFAEADSPDMAVLRRIERRTQRYIFWTRTSLKQ